MKLAFCTTVVIGFDCIKELIINGYKLEFIITLEDDYLPNKSGRVSLNSFAEKHSIDLIKVKNINQSVVVNALNERGIDYFFVIGWSQIASVEVIKAVNKFVIGAHPTLLPKGRGRAAIPWTILKGLKWSGVTFFKIDDKVDTGDILYQQSFDVEEDETATSLYAKVAKAHSSGIIKLMRSIQDLTLVPQSQDESLATYWPGRKREDGLLSSSMTLEMVSRLVRAVTKPYPGAYLDFGDYQIIIWSGGKKQLSDNDLQLKFKDGYYYAHDWSKR
jgi:methionyl-tRNA formyltransferase